jgi:hypothetical protein
MVGIEHKIAQKKDMRGTALYVGAKVVCFTRHSEIYSNIGELSTYYISGMSKYGEIVIVGKMDHSHGYCVWNPEKNLLLW